MRKLWYEQVPHAQNISCQSELPDPGANLEYLRHSSDGRKQENIQYDANKSIYMESYVSTSQTMSVLSFEPDTMRRPSGENATDMT